MIMIENFIQKIQNSKMLSFEISPPKGANFDETLQKIEKSGLIDKIDGFITTDSPLAKLRYSSILASIKTQTFFNKPSIATISMRDRNSFALQADLIGANDFNLRCFLALTGDGVNHGDQPQAKGVFEQNSLFLLQIINALNSQKDIANNPLKEPLKPIYGFCVLNSYSKKLESLKRKMAKKIETGCIAIVTQPVYDLDVANMLHDWLVELTSKYSDFRKDTKLIFGFFPVVSYKGAYFLYSKLPGVFIPDSWLERLEIASKISKDEEFKVGFEMSQKLLETIYSTHQKLHLMSSNNAKLMKDLIEGVA
ncbi:MAG: methylenetetrahydrofolate reductase [Campylobacterales bacterium]|nr:methylenetetrahydrofolate reductase [Campylobacterales bacterium]